MLLFHPSYQVFKKKVHISAPKTCDAVAVVSVADGYCWVLIYRPPDCTPEDTDQLCRYLDSFLCEHQYITIMGDFNTSKINWLSSDELQQVDVLQRKFLQFCVSWDLHQIVTKPTRGNNHLDIILTTHPERYNRFQTVPPLINSDHDTVLCHLQQMIEHKPSTPVRLVRCYNDADYSAIDESLSKCQWRHIFAYLLVA